MQPIIIINLSVYIIIDEYIPFCRFDFVKFSNERNFTFGKYCGQKTGQTVVVTGGYAIVTFYSNSRVRKRGFSLLFNTTPLGMYN